MADRRPRTPGVGGALLTPASLAILQASFGPSHRSKAVGAWSGMVGVASATGPLIGGWVVDVWSWRLIFLINLPLAVVVVAAVRYLPETRNPSASGQRLDVVGGALAWLTIRNRLQDDRQACPSSGMDARVHCSVDGAPIASDSDVRAAQEAVAR